MELCNYKKKYETMDQSKDSYGKLNQIRKKINSELTTKINSSKIKHGQIYLLIDSDDIIDVIFFLKTNENTKLRQLIDITAVDFPEREQRFRIVYLLLSHEFNTRVLIEFDISEGEKIPSLTKIFLLPTGWKESF